MTEKLTDVFAAASRVLAASLEEQRRAQGRRRQRWMDDIQLERDLFKMDCRRVHAGMSLSYMVALYFLEGMGDIAAQRLLALHLPILETLQRIEINFAKVPGYSIWHHDDIRLYAGNKHRVDP